MDLVEIMRKQGFSFLRPVGFLADPRTGEILQIDALFGRHETVRGRSMTRVRQPVHIEPKGWGREVWIANGPFLLRQDPGDKKG